MNKRILLEHIFKNYFFDFLFLFDFFFFFTTLRLFLTFFFFFFPKFPKLNLLIGEGGLSSKLNLGGGILVSLLPLPLLLLNGPLGLEPGVSNISSSCSSPYSSLDGDGASALSLRGVAGFTGPNLLLLLLLTLRFLFTLLFFSFFYRNL